MTAPDDPAHAPSKPADGDLGAARAAAIRRIVAERRIEDLIHFTHSANLPSIMAHGLLSVQASLTSGIEPRRNDRLRLDGRLDGTSLSISFPNVGMLNKYRQAEPDEDFVVLVLDPSILWAKDCALYPVSAADRLVRHGDLATLKSPWGLEDMFAGIVENASRHLGPMHDCDPTHQQAEVLVFDDIEPDLVRGVEFDCERARDAYTGILGTRGHDIQHGREGLFGQRFHPRPWVEAR